MASAELQLRNALYRKLLGLRRDKSHSFSAHDLVGATVLLMDQDLSNAASQVKQIMKNTFDISVKIEIKEYHIFKVKFL